MKCPLEKKSYEQERSIIKIWQSTSLAHRPIATIKNSDLIRIRDEWLKHLKPSTIVRRFAVLSHLYTVAIKDWLWNYLEVNPVQLIRKPSVKDERNRRVYDQIRIIGSNPIECPQSEVDWIVRETKSNTLPTLIILAIETAMRRSELTSIYREHIDFNQGTIYVPQSKNGYSRLIPLSPIARHALIRYLSNNNHSNKVFNISATAVTRAFIRARRKAKCRYRSLCLHKNQEPNTNYFTDFRWHDLRHEATSRLATVYEMHELAKITGHKDTRMLLRYYHPDVHVLNQKLAQSAFGQQQFNAINHMLLQML